MNIIFIHRKESDTKNSSKAQEIQDRLPESIVHKSGSLRSHGEVTPQGHPAN